MRRYDGCRIYTVCEVPDFNTIPFPRADSTLVLMDFMAFDCRGGAGPYLRLDELLHDT